MSKASRQYLLYTDGASRGNPGPASVGVVIKDHNEEVLWEEGQAIGKQTNNVAEYTALIVGLKQLQKMGAKSVKAFADSELMVKQIKGVYRVKNHGIKPLYEEAMDYIDSINNFQIQHIRREFNEEADALANQALDSL